MRVSAETVLNTAEDQVHAAPVVIRRPQHTLSRSNVSGNALKVLYRLKKCGHQAFIVGGGVRDLLVGLSPKDFDVVTDARPEQVRALFRNCRLIGRRFRLAHVRFGREVIEVVTFRSSRSGAEDDREHTDGGRILRDNVYGTIDEDIWRRDFTVNALYYNIADFSILGLRRRDGGYRQPHPAADRRPGGRGIARTRSACSGRRGCRRNWASASPKAPRGPSGNWRNCCTRSPRPGSTTKPSSCSIRGTLPPASNACGSSACSRYLFPHTDRTLRADKNGVALRLVQTGLDNTDQRVKEEKPVTPMFLLRRVAVVPHP